MPVTALPTPPSRNDPVNFPTRADNFLGALPTFALELNDLQLDVNNAESAAAASASAANAAANAASLAAGVSAWVSGTTYSIGQQVWSPTTFQTFRRRTNGAGTTDPASDPTNWEPLSISSTSGITLNNNVSYKSRLSGGSSYDLLKINTSNGTELYGSDSVSLAVNGNSVIFVNSAGNVGIGTTIPGAKLEVIGNQANFRRYGSTTAPFYHASLRARGSGVSPSTVLNGDSIGEYQFFGHDGTSDRHAGSIYCSVDGVPASGTVPGQVVIATTPSGTNQLPVPRVTVKSTGDVGIGLTNPTALLDIGKSGTTTVRVSNTQGGSGEVVLSLDPSFGGVGVRDTQIRAQSYPGDNSDFTILTSSAGVSSAKVRVSNVGNVGIGTTNPLRPLHISASEPAIILGESDQTSDNRNWRIFSSSANFTIDALNDAATAAQAAYVVNRVGTIVTGHSFLTNGVSRLNITSDGKVNYGGIEIGYKNVPRTTTGLEEGKCFATPSGFTLSSGAAAGSTYSVYNDSASTITITQGVGLTLRLAGSTSTGNRTIAPRGMATIWYNSSTEAVITGAGVL